MYMNVVITAANSPYFESLLTLISSLHKHSFDVVDSTIVYNLGLDSDEIKILNGLERVVVREFPQEVHTYFKGYLEPKSHAYKLFCVKEAGLLQGNILWLDAGVMALQNVKEIFDIISHEDIFLVGDEHLNGNYTSPTCIKILNASESELQDVQLSSGILGYKTNGKYQSLINEAFEYSKIPNCVPGDENNHRHDQSVYSILASRYGCKKYDIDRYGYWTSISRNLQTAIEKDAVIFVHRRGHREVNNLRHKKS